MDTLREQVAQETRTLLFSYNVGTDYIEPVSSKFANQILNLLKQALKDVKPLGDEERMNVNIPCETCDKTPIWGNPTAHCIDCIAKCQNQAAHLNVIDQIEKKL